MDKDIRKVRKSIEQRKRSRGIPTAGPPTMKKQVPSFLPDTEEGHGYYPVVKDVNDVQPRNRGNLPAAIAVKGMLSVLLFVGVAFIWQVEAQSLQKPREWTSQVLKNEFPFAKVNVWYKETFGQPLSLSPQPASQGGHSPEHALPVSGSIAESFEANGKGIKISPGETASVSAIDDGVVIFAGNDRDTEKTVAVQHSDGSVSNYGNLSTIDVHLYQFISANQLIGSFSPKAGSETIYFSIEKDNGYIDPVQVIKVDEAP